VEGIWQDWKTFTGSAPLHDDACLVVVGCRPAALLTFTSEAKCCRDGRNFVENWGRFAGVSDLGRGQMVLAVDEAVTNVIRHTYDGQPGHRIELSAALEDGMLIFRIRDFGPPLDLAKLQGRALEDVKPGGLGIPLLKMIFQKVNYVPKDPGTELELGKLLE
jgi:anti-sigma regulatory factor (Ser/Thr protein kinase)